MCLEQFLVEGWNESFEEFKWLPQSQEDTAAVQDEFKKITRTFPGFKKLAPYFLKKALYQKEVRFIPSLNSEDSLTPFNDLTIINLSA